MAGRILILEVAVALDPFPGNFHDSESAVNIVQHILNQSIPHYHPTVQIAPDQPA
jgi:hypothetical protein